MRNKKIIYITITAVLLGLIALSLILSNTTSTLRKELSDFAVKDTGTIEKVFISDMNFNSVKLERKPEGGWTVNEAYEVNNENIKTLFKTLVWVEVREPVPQKHQDEINALLASTGVKVEIYQNRYRIDWFDKIKLFPYVKKTKTFYVGEATSDQMGTYMLMENSTKPFVTYMPGFRGFLNTRFSPREKDWRSPVIFSHKLGEIKSIKLEFPENPENSFKIDNLGDRTFELFALGDSLTR
ncbi:MAG: DUF4340 domain-containing protein, partial [Bacteroidales bacterium]|nr:DUF4340 domain-containing protein [Bacteroidales bacterium]